MNVTTVGYALYRNEQLKIMVIHGLPQEKLLTDYGYNGYRWFTA